ncbi:hypothetical protein [Paenibacillus piri]|nr:hypothetical protein [Paenibacillus piri]
MDKKYTKNRITATPMSFLLVFLPVIQFVMGGIAFAANEIWTDITGTGNFNSPRGIAVDSSDDVYVADTYNNKDNLFSNICKYKFG